MASTDLEMAALIPIAPAVAASPTVRAAASAFMPEESELSSCPLSAVVSAASPASAAQATEVNAISSVASAKIRIRYFVHTLIVFIVFSPSMLCLG